MAISSLSITSVNLYAAAAEARPRRERECCEPRGEHGGGPMPRERGSVLADAMLGALQSLGWTRADSTEVAKAATAPAPTNAPDGTSVEDAVAEFAAALAGALRDLRRSERGEGCREGRGHGGGHDRGHRGVGGMAPRIEMLVVQLRSGAAAPSPQPADPPPEVAAARLPEPVAVPATAAPVAIEAEAAESAAADVPEPETLIVAAPPAPEAPEGLVDAFKNLLDSLRDNGLKPPLEESASESLARFLKALADGLKPSAPGSRYDTTPVFYGTFVRITA